MKSDYIKNIETAERRFFSEVVELREEGEDQFFEGYAARFNSPTDLGYFTEEIMPGAFDSVMNDDVRGLFNHDPDVVLGRTKSGTMQVVIDERGAKYKIKYNANDPDHVRVMEKVKRGDVSQSSFAFSIESENIVRKEDAKVHRQITKLKRWYDVAPVTYPAYTDTSVAARSIDSLKEEEKRMQEKDESERKQLENDLYLRDITKRKFKL
jgi:HK97 family phage prohead protease